LLLVAGCGSSGGGKKKGSGNPNANLSIDVGGGNSTGSGSTISGLKDGDSVTIEFLNSGADAVTLGPVLVDAQDDLDVRDFELLFESENSAISAGPSQDGELEFPFDLVSSDPVYGEVLRPDPQRLGAWALAGETVGSRRVLRGLPLPDDQSVDLVLRSVKLPVSSELEVQIDGQRWSTAAGEALAGMSLWKGKVANEPNSDVYLALAARGCRGWIQRGDALYMINAEPDEMLAWQSPTLRIARYARLQRAGAVPKRDFVCEAVPMPDLEPQHGDDGFDTSNAPPPPLLPASRAKLAIETDEALFDDFGDAGAATAYIVSLIGAVSDRYQSRVQVGIEMVSLNLYDLQSDPWGTPENGGTALDLLNEFRDYYGTTWPGQANNADLAHLLSADLDQGGIAYYADGGVLCNRTGAFGVSTGLTLNNSQVDWDNFNYKVSPFIWDFVVVAHEIGHNFGAIHTHEYCPPFDECADPSAFGTCQTQRNCGPRGTILSYCHTCAGGVNKIRPDFEPYIANEMRAALAGSCLPGSVLNPGESLTFTLTYSPQANGASAAELSWTHNASNLPSPFSLLLEGE